MQLEFSSRKLIVQKLNDLLADAISALYFDYFDPSEADNANIEIHNLYEKLIITFQSLGMDSAKEDVEKIFAECENDLLFVIEEPPRHSGEYLVVRKFYNLLENYIFAHSSSGISEPVQEEAESRIVLFPIEIVEGTREYIKRVANQANGCYQFGYYDACSVMIRRLIETLIIECFERYGLEGEIKNDGDFVRLDNLINIFLSKQNWNVGRTAKKCLRKLPDVKILGDMSAHSRRYIAREDDLNKISYDLRIIIEELVSISFPK